MWKFIRHLIAEPLMVFLLLGAGWLFDNMYAGIAAAVIVPIAIEIAGRWQPSKLSEF